MDNNGSVESTNGASGQSLFQSFLQGGFECATHRRRDCQRIDVVADTEHDLRAREDYDLLAQAGIRTVRDGLRWHLIETEPGHYDWSSFLPMLRAAHATHTQVIWDLCHWGVPHGIDVFSPAFVDRFAAFAGAAAKLIRAERKASAVQGSSWFCAINEISFWAWVGGDVQHFLPYGEQRGPQLKRQLVRASLAAMHAVREADPSARFVQPEPIIHISADPAKPEDAKAAAQHTASQFEAWDMLAGRMDAGLGGGEAMLDVLGINYYWNNQWIHEGQPTPPGHPLHRPLHRMLIDLWKRYQRPILIAETGSEAGAEFGWLGYVMGEIRQAQRLGVPVEGVCLYPVMDYPGWDNGRHCRCGLIALDEEWKGRELRQDLCREVVSFQHPAQPGCRGERPTLPLVRDSTMRGI